MDNPPEIKRDRPRAVVDVLIEHLKPSPDNPRAHSARQLRMLGRSIKKFGFVGAVLIDEDNQIIAGHGRVLAAKKLGYATVPTLKVSHLSKAEARAYLVADNRLAEKSGWDRKLLAIQLHEFKELGFDLEEVGFETAEVDIILEDAAEADGASYAEDRVPAIETKPVTRSGELWHLGQHRLICGDATMETAYAQLMDGEKAEFVFTDPPYNVRINGHVSGLGRTRHREFRQARGEMSRARFTDFLFSSFERMATHAINGSIHQICMDWRHAHEMLIAGEQVYDKLLNICVWNKTNAGMGSFYRSQYELVFVWQKGNGPHINNIELGRHGRSRSNVWTYPGVNTFKRERMREISMHPTVKPVALVADAIKDCSLRGGLVLDPFGGSGTTLVAAERTDRRARAIDIDPLYVDVAVRRWQSFTGRSAVHAETGLSFEEVEERRMGELKGAAVR